MARRHEIVGKAVRKGAKKTFRLAQRVTTVAFFTVCVPPILIFHMVKNRERHRKNQKLSGQLRK